MESSRNGSLTALLMFLPLVAVPVIALLRPPPQLDGAAEKLQRGDALDQFASEFLPDAPPAEPVVENPRATGGLQDEAAWLDPFAEPTAPITGNRTAEVSGFDARENSGGFTEPEDDPLNPFREVAPFPESTQRNDLEPPAAGRVSPEPNAPLSGETMPEAVVTQLRELGVTHYQWLPVGENQGFGFAAFVAGTDDTFTVRFGSIQSTRQQAVLDVVRQIAAWKTRTNGLENSGDSSSGAANGLFQ